MKTIQSGDRPRRALKARGDLTCLGGVIMPCEQIALISHPLGAVNQ